MDDFPIPERLSTKVRAWLEDVDGVDTLFFYKQHVYKRASLGFSEKLSNLCFLNYFKYEHINLVQENTFYAVMIRLTFYPNLISSKMLSRKFHSSSPMAYHHRCPLNHASPYGGGGQNFKLILLQFWLQIQIPDRKTAFHLLMFWKEVGQISQKKNRGYVRVRLVF